MIDTGIPLGVRLYDIKDGVDRHLTKWVDDFSFRHTAPGGCASCTIKFHIPDMPNVDPQLFGRLFYRIQIFDARSAEVLWEGRVEDPATQVSDRSWELGVLGSQVAATDINAPMMYVDNTVGNWRIDPEVEDLEIENNDVAGIITAKLKPGWTWTAGQFETVGEYNALARCMNRAVARASATYKGSGPGGQGANFEMIMSMFSIYPADLDTTAMTTGGVYKTNRVGTEFALLDADQSVYFAIRRKAGSGNYTIGANDEGIARFKYPKILGMRLDEVGNTLATAADYSNDWITVNQVVRDVVGRYLAGGWFYGAQGAYQSTTYLVNTGWGYPEKGSVRGSDAFIDSSDVQKITNLWWEDSVNAKVILDTMMLVQPNAYWAIWDSGHRFENSNSDKTLVREHQFRFAWATWPRSWNYIASSQDGMQQQISGDQLFNYVTLTYDDEFTVQTGVKHGAPNFGIDDTGLEWKVEELESRFTRSFYINAGNLSPDTTNTELLTTMAQKAIDTQEPTNVGTMTICRPIFMYDDGSSDGRGYAGMVEPWRIRPGKLIKIQDIQPNANSGQMQWDSGFGRVLNTNTGFETGTTAGWALSFGTLTAATDRVYSGTRSGKIVPTGATVNTFASAAPAVPASPRSTYRASAWVQCDVARAINLEIHWFNAAAALITTTPLIYNVPADQWRYLEVIGTAPPTAVSANILLGMGSTPPASNILWFDEAKLEHLMGFPRGQENCIFRVAATEYNTSDNSCKLELDQLPRWNLSTQVAGGDAPGNLRVRKA